LLQPVYGLAILDDYITPKNEETDFYHHYKTVNIRTIGDASKGPDKTNPDKTNPDEIKALPFSGQSTLDETKLDVIKGLEYVLVELPKFKPEKWTDQKMAVLWLRFLREVQESATDVDEDLMANEDIRKAVDLCEAGAFTPVELAASEKYWDRVRWEISTNKTSHSEGFTEGHAEGHAEGLEIGKEEREKLALEKEKLAQILEEKDKAISEKDKAILEKDKALEQEHAAAKEKDKALEQERAAAKEKDNEIAELRRLLNKK
jgi:hypothetical protein